MVMPALLCPSCKARLNLPAKLPEKIQVLRCPQCKLAIPAQAVRKLLGKLQGQAPAKTATTPAAPRPKSAVVAATPKGAGPPAAKASDTSLLPDLDDIGIKDDPDLAPAAAAAPTTRSAPPDTELLTDLDEVKI